MREEEEIGEKVVEREDRREKKAAERERGEKRR